MKKLIPIYINLLIIFAIDVFLICLSWYGAFFLRFNFSVPVESSGMALRMMPVVVIVKMVVFYFFHVYQGMWRYTSITDLFNIIKGAFLSSLIILSLVLYVHHLQGWPRSVFVIDCFFSILFVSGSRICLRLYFMIMDERVSKSTLAELFSGKQKERTDDIHLLIIGAGDSGEKIFREIRDNPRLNYYVVGYIDDDYRKQNKMIHGVPVMGRVEDLETVAGKVDAHEILIAVPSADAGQMRTIVESCKRTALPFKTLPGLGELINGKISLNLIRDVAYRDLLGREVVELEEELIGGYIRQKAILVTGAGGSIGSELCRQICRFNPKTLILFEQAESPLYDIDLELRRSFPYIEIAPVLGDIRNLKRLRKTFKWFKPNNVFHAAAYKHVPMLEVQPWEAILNNVGGTRNVVEVAIHHGVERFVMVSTDKAVRPTNVMGTTKRVAELLVQGQNCDASVSTKFITVRFGNVVGSVGSVVPLFKKQIAKGGPVTITHPEVTRYFMTIPEASQLILQAGAMGRGGETFILEMGTSVKIADMARDLIRLSGFEPDKDIPIEYIGLRPGEKLYEELITQGEDIVPTEHKKIMVLSGCTCALDHLNGQIDQVIEVAKTQDGKKIKEMLKEMVPEYQPANH